MFHYPVRGAGTHVGRRTVVVGRGTGLAEQVRQGLPGQGREWGPLINRAFRRPRGDRDVEGARAAGNGSGAGNIPAPAGVGSSGRTKGGAVHGEYKVPGGKLVVVDVTWRTAHYGACGWRATSSWNPTRRWTP
ncbi:hypothetical protein GCM10023238_08400 [Streptomyces heliomycini]